GPGAARARLSGQGLGALRAGGVVAPARSGRGAIGLADARRARALRRGAAAAPALPLRSQGIERRGALPAADIVPRAGMTPAAGRHARADGRAGTRAATPAILSS